MITQRYCPRGEYTEADLDDTPPADISPANSVELLTIVLEQYGYAGLRWPWYTHGGPCECMINDVGGLCETTCGGRNWRECEPW